MNRQKILIVDDRRENLVALSQTLSEIDAEVIQAHNGNEALAACLNHDFALAILDVQMPGMDGFELAALLLHDKKTENLPVIFLSAAYVTETHSFRGYNSGAVDYIVKPYEPYILLAKVRVFLNLNHQRLELLRYQTQLEETVSVRTSEVELALQAANMGLWSIDILENKLYFDGQTCNLMGIDHGGFQGKPEEFFNAVHPEDREKVKKLLDDTIRNNVLYEPKYRSVWPDGTVHDICGRGKLIRDSEDRALRIIGVVWDITEHRLMEESLRQAEKMTAIGQLAGGIAHDFNNQLTSILGYADLLANRLEDPALNQFARNIKMSALRSADLTTQLLAFSRKGKFLNAPVDIHSIIGEVRELLKRSIDKRIDIHQHLDANPSVVKGDPTQLQNSLLNLALNARDAMPDGGKLIFSTSIAKCADVIDFKNDFPAENCLEISVSDTGVGMDARTRARLFEPFFTTKEKGKGTGLGLASVYGTVSNHGGIIRVFSEVGKGSTFKIFLPVNNELPVRTHENSKPDSIPVGGTGRILLVDDESMVLRVAKDMLEMLGYDVTECVSPEMAMELYRKSWREFDLVIIDMVMPGMGGKELFRELRKINPEIKSFLASGYSLDGEAQQILDDGVLGFIQKPFNFNDVSLKIAAVLTSR
jgi:PAS domain S-box-containing protein